MADTDQQGTDQQQPPASPPPAPAPVPAPPAQDGMPAWATDLQRQLNELGATVAKLPETTVNAVREATQPAKQPRQRTATKTAGTQSETRTEPPPTEQQSDSNSPGKSKSFGDWWFNG